jgi:ribonuclease E
VQAFSDTVPSPDAEGGEAREGGRRRRRGRGGRDRDDARNGEAVVNENGEQVANASGDDTARAELPVDAAAPQGESVESADAPEGGNATPEGGERDGRRRGRGRDRQRRERRDETDGSAPPAEGAEPGAAGDSPAAAVAEPAYRSEIAEAPAYTPPAYSPPAYTPPVQAPVVEAPIPAPVVAQAPAVTAPVATLVAAPVAAPVERFVLPLSDLQSVAQTAGLEWVNSDADKIRAVQEAMAREPKPIHVPREPRPPVAIDEGPLVLVETRKDLSQVKLPFESESGKPAA